MYAKKSWKKYVGFLIWHLSHDMTIFQKSRRPWILLTKLQNSSSQNPCPLSLTADVQVVSVTLAFGAGLFKSLPYWPILLPWQACHRQTRVSYSCVTWLWFNIVFFWKKSNSFFLFFFLFEHHEGIATMNHVQSNIEILHVHVSLCE